MSDWLLKNIDRFFRWLAILIILSAAALMTNFEIKDLDIWLHLASGNYILQHKFVPQVDFLSCSISGKPWVNHEWLFQVLIAELYKFFGPEGWISLQGVLVGMSLAVLLLLSFNQENKLFLAWLIFAIVRVFEFRILMRPDTVSLLFFLIYLTVIFKFLRKKYSPWILFIFQVIWTNMHGFFILGPLMLLIVFATEFVRRKSKIVWIQQTTSWMDDYEYAQIKKSLLFVLAACLFNPYFINGAIYPIKILFLTQAHETFFAKISELQAPLSWKSLFILDEYIWYKFLMLVSIISFVLNRKRCNLTVFVIWVLLLFFSLKAMRNILFFSSMAVFATAYNVRQFLPRTLLYARWADTSKWYIVSIILHLFLIGQVKDYIDRLALAGYFDFDKFERKSEFGGVSLRNYSYRAVDFLVKEKIKGNFINDFNSGAYLLGRTYPNIKVFIDGRTEVYGVKLFNEYDEIIHGDKKLLDQEVERSRITGAFLNSVYSPLPSEFMRNIYFDPKWKLVYFDYDAMIFLLDIPENKSWVDKFSISLSDWKAPKADLLKFGVHPVEPYQYYRRAQLLFNLKLYDKAKEELIESLRISPNYEQSFSLLSRIYLEEKQYDLAFEYARKAKVISPGDYEVRYFLAAAAFYLGDIKLAKEQCHKVLAANNQHVKTLFLIAKIYFKENETLEALHTLRRTIDLDSGKNLESVEGMVDFLLGEGKQDSAKKVYEMMVEKNLKNEKNAKPPHDLSGLKSRLNGL